MNTPDLEYKIAQYIGVRNHLIVPNMFWGFGFRYELDLLVVTKSRYMWEVELKTSRADLKADQKKNHRHDDSRIRRLYFAMPESIYDPTLVPEKAGVLLVKESNGRVEQIKSPKEMRGSKLTDREYQKLLELMSMRVWSEKKKALRLVKTK